ncbi:MULTISPECIES: stage II sporulation protein P [Clostridium]|uniref:Stage II sporulation protein P (SpoIIP) n=4 Tax=Clostridium TaxID=1485 RepID=A0ABX2TUD9_CLOLD|nr:Stage II sporulation protein P (SpoIIP) [Clostridium autoethanogenum DSM 10061]OAA87349.1 Stage II sporulation protein P (SpoIIP) [Clostridium ljungdahlii DSM 13528]OVY50199.1 Stage II sporulation protein P (SpoIIP) [Clostridium autoethanogenum]
MNYRRFNFKGDPKLEMCILMLTVILVIILPCIAKANSYSSNVKRNMFYVEVLNYAMPTVKTTSFSEDDMAENCFSIGNTILKTVGLDINNPKSLLGREVAFLGLGYSKNQDISFNEFKLDDKQIKKNGSTSKSNTQNDLNLENKDVTVYNPKLKKTLDVSKPEVLIYHTHTTESYKPGDANSFDTTQNVCAVGDVIVNELQNNYGISAINDKTVHDAEAYTQSYSRSAVTLDKYLKKYGDFKLIIDLHRDSVDDKKSVTARMNGENISKFMLVMARKNPHFDKNMAMANSIIDTSNKLFPGLCKGVCYYNYGTRYFNQDKSNNAILMEIGADINTSDESKATGKYVARIIAEVLNNK